MENNKELNTNWAMARALLGIQANKEEQELLTAGKRWTRYIDDLLRQSSNKFKKRNFNSTVLGKLGTVLGSAIGGNLAKDSKWSEAAKVGGSIAGSTAGRFVGATTSDPSSVSPDYDEFLEANPDIDIAKGKFYKDKREAFKEGRGLDITDFDIAQSDAYSEEQMANILSGMTDVYTMSQVSKDGELDWLYDLFDKGTSNKDTDIPEDYPRDWE